MKHVLILFALLLSSLTARAQVAYLDGGHFRLGLHEDDGHQVLRLEGNFLRPSDYTQSLPVLRQIDASKKVLVLDLNFGGGLGHPIENFSRRIRRITREAGITLVTVIRSGSWCASFCTLIYMAGDVRAATEFAQFGFHTATAFNGRISVTAAMIGNYAQYGVSRRWLNEHRDYFVRREITALRPADLEGSNIVTHTFTFDFEFDRHVQRLVVGEKPALASGISETGRR